MRRISLCMLVVLSFILCNITTNSYAEDKIEFVFRIGSSNYEHLGVDWEIDENPEVVPFVDEMTNRTHVPLRCFAERLGCLVEWDEKQDTAILKKGFTEIFLPIGGNISRIYMDTGGEPMPYPYVDGIYATSMPILMKEYSMDVAALIRAERTFVPLRFVADILGYNVEWNEVEQSVALTKRDILQDVKITTFVEQATGAQKVGVKITNNSNLPIFGRFGGTNPISLKIVNNKGEVVPIGQSSSPAGTHRVISPEMTQEWFEYIQNEKLQGGKYTAIINIAGSMSLFDELIPIEPLILNFEVKEEE